MASLSKTVTVAEASPSSTGSWSKVSSPASLASAPSSSDGVGMAAASPSSASVASNESADDDLTYHFKQMGLPQAESWARKFYQAGYADMGQMADADLPAVFQELQVKSGIQIRLQEGMQHFRAGTFNQAYMPLGDLDSTAPRQSRDGPRWWLWGGGSVAAALVVVAAADCLHGDTLVTMADRSKKKIQDVKVGDKILSYNKGKLRVKTVLEVTEGSSKTMRELSLRSPDGTELSIKATGGHPFYTKEMGWGVASPDEGKFDKSRPVKQLSLGDTLVVRGGAGAKLLKIGEVLPKQKTYNLIIDGPGTFFAENILSHSGLPPAKKWWADGAAAAWERRTAP